MNSNTSRLDDNTDSDSDSDVAFVNVDFSGVDFDRAYNEENDDDNKNDPAQRSQLLDLECSVAFGDFNPDQKLQKFSNISDDLLLLAEQLSSGDYVDILRQHSFFKNIPSSNDDNIVDVIKNQVKKRATSLEENIEIEFVAVAALNLFLQGNYTGPSLEDIEAGHDESSNVLADINPHSSFQSLKRLRDDIGARASPENEAKVKGGTDSTNPATTTTRNSTPYHNAILTKLAVDGEWPCQVCHGPYFLLLATTILEELSTLDDYYTLQAVHLWYARALVAHERLLQAHEPTVTLWNKTKQVFDKCQKNFCNKDQADQSQQPNIRAATVMLEFGLAEHHFDRPGKGRQSFLQAQQYSKLRVEVTGSKGKRTKFQQKSTAQMLVKAESVTESLKIDLQLGDDEPKQIVKDQLVEHAEDGILLERIKFEDEKENKVTNLSILDQSIILALCLDVKNSNPNDGLTNEEIGAYLAVVLDHHDDWMVYSTGLLERSWAEFERSHARERSLLQLQALADQHTNRLTFTQSTQKSISESAPASSRLKNLHSIVYPPRWAMLQDLADRYASMGIVTSAAELYTEIELWDDVVDCYRRAGRIAKAEEIVRERLLVSETPRMWCALGDLTNNPAHYSKAIEMSNGSFSKAYIALGHYYFEKGELELALENYERSLKIRPLSPAIWFRVGTISMQLKLWDKALRAFSEVVQQEPEEADAWANVAAVHMHNKLPAEAYPALNESIKYNRNNWRVWNSKLYTCLDLQKYDEAIQACNALLDLRQEKGASENVPALEEKCVRAIVGGTLQNFHSSRGDQVATDSARRSLTRMHELLDRLESTQPEPWVFEAIAFLHAQIGDDNVVLESLMKEYRSLQSNHGWEKDDFQINKLCQIVSHIIQLNLRQNTRENLVQAKYLARGVLKEIRTGRPDDATLPDIVNRLDTLLLQVQKSINDLQ